MLIIILILGMLASLSPTTIVVFILLLGTARARENAAAFLVGWGVSLTVVFFMSYALGGTLTVRQVGGHAAVDVGEIVVGVVLILLGTRRWLDRHQPKQGSGVSKKLTARLDHMNPMEATVVGVLEQPWTLTTAAAFVVLHHYQALTITVIAFAIFTIVSTATVGFIFLYYARDPGQAAAKLSTLKGRVTDAGPAIFAAVCLIVGIYLIVDGALGIA